MFKKVKHNYMTTNNAYTQEKQCTCAFMRSSNVQTTTTTTNKQTNKQTNIILPPTHDSIIVVTRGVCSWARVDGDSTLLSTFFHLE